jgi:hypothetical protein
VTYLLDSNVFIEAKNRYYAFDLCPGFWTWMDHIVVGGEVSTIQMVRDELLGGNDDLAQWMKERRTATWIVPQDDGPTQQVFQRIATTLAAKQYSQPAVSSFLSGADPWLVAKAKGLGATVVTMETHEPKSVSRVPLPNVCADEAVPFVSTFDFLRSMEAQFHYEVKRPKKGKKH